jgi:hypothetical protein
MTKTERDAKRWQALIKHTRIELDDYADAEPVFKVVVPVSWQIGNKGFVKVIDRLIKDQENENNQEDN